MVPYRFLLPCFPWPRVSHSRRALVSLLSLGFAFGALLAAPAPSEGQAWTATWTRKADAAPGPRAWVDMAFDPAQGRAVLFGGTASQPLNDVWQYDTAADRWLQLEPAQACPSNPSQPTGRAGYALEYDPLNQFVWIFGGTGVGCTGAARTAGKGTNPNAIVDQSLAGTTVDFYKGWTVTVGDASTYVSAYDPTMKKLSLATPLAGAHWWNPYFLYPPPGSATASYSSGTKTWGTSTGSEPVNRASPAMAYSTRGGAIVMFGGQGLSDTWALDVRAKSWRQLIPIQGSASPPGLAEVTNSMAYDSDNDVFVLFGGCLCTGGGGASSGDTWAYRLSTNSWTRMTPTVSPPPRQGHNLVYDSGNKRVVLFGGFDATSGTYFNDLWIYSFTTNTWTMVFPLTSPPARRVAAMVYDPVQQRTTLYGGKGPESLTDVWSLELAPPASGTSAPVLTSLSPSSAIVGSPNSTLTVTGANFASSSVVRWNGVPRSTTFMRGTQLQAIIGASDLASPTTAQVSVATPPSAGGGTSGSLAFAVVAPPAAPSLSSISPATASAGGATFTLSATGTNFASNSVVRVNAANRATTFVSATQLTATIPAADIASAGSRDITVLTPAPGGGTSSPATLNINNPAPVLGSIAPASLKAWGLAFALTVTGSNFVSASTVQVNGAVRATTYVSPTQLTATIPASDLATSSSNLAITVTSPSPGGGTSSVASLAVAQPALSVTATSLTPNASVTATLTNSPGNASDTIALALVGSSVTSSIQSVAVSSLPGTTSKTWAVTMPATPGQYEFRFLPSNGSVVAATSPAMAVVAAADPTPSASSSSIRQPVLAFTDLIAGPRSGNTDTSQGQTSGTDGALVTVWGYNLGSSQGSSTITVGGTPARAVYYWGNATPPNCGAANLYNNYQKLQCIVFQIAGSTPTGSQNVVVTVGDVASSALTFTVTTTGRIFYVATSGRNDAAGTFSSPWATTQFALDAMASGDITYVRTGVSEPGGASPGTNSQAPTGPIALVAYPGAVVAVGDATHDAFGLSHSGSGHYMIYAKLGITGAAQAVTLASNARLVGSNIQAPRGVGSLGTVGMSPYIDGFNVVILGNEFTNCGDPNNIDSLYHVVYLSGMRGAGAPTLETDREVGWNYFHDNSATRAINIYNGEVNSNPISRHRVHDNVIVNQLSDGILLSKGVVGENWVYNNLIITAGQAPAGWSNSGIYLHAGWAGLGWSTMPDSTFPKSSVILHIYNNTIINAGFSGSASGGWLITTTAEWTPDIHNNLTYQTNGQPYVASGSDGQSANSAQWSNNLWYGAGPAPRFDSSAVAVDPLLVSATGTLDLHLQSGSPARGAGIVVTSPSLDFDGVSRPSSGTWDIGAYQSAGGSGSTVTVPLSQTIAPPPPSTPTVALVVAGDPAAGPYAVEAQTTAPGPLTVKFFVDGTPFGQESIPKYCIFGGDATCAVGILGAGTHVIKAQVFQQGGTVVLGETQTTLTESSSLLSAASLSTSSLATAASAPSIAPPPPSTPTVALIVAGDPAAGPYAVEAQTTAPGPLTVKFLVDGTPFGQESIPKYCLFGGDATCTGGILGTGPHAVKAQVFQQGGTVVLAEAQITLTESSSLAPASSSTNPLGSVASSSGSTTPAPAPSTPTVVATGGPATGPTFTRGEWSRWAGSSGTLTLRQAIWTSDGTALDFNGNPIAKGVNFSDGTNRTNDPIATLFTGNAIMGAIDTTRKRWVTTPSGGHGGWTLWEVNELDWATGTWNPDGRPQAPFSRIIRIAPLGGANVYQSGEWLGGQKDSPAALLDPHHYYDSYAKVDAALGIRAFPNGTHTQANFRFMPSVGRFLFWGGYGSDWTGNGQLIWPFEWDPNAKQWESVFSQFSLLSAPGAGTQNTALAWDSTHNWMLHWRADDNKLFRYDPAAAAGSRIALLYNGGSSATNQQGAMLYDSKRKRAVYLSAYVDSFHGEYPAGSGNFYGWDAAGPCYFDLTNPAAVTRTAFSISGDRTVPIPPVGGDFKVPGWAYDPIGDRYLLWLGGKTVYWVDPVSFVATAYTPSGGITPQTRTWGTANGGYSLEYLPGDDVFIGVNHADTSGFEVFAPVRNAPSVPSQK